jgi:hypothetical protein
MHASNRVPHTWFDISIELYSYSDTGEVSQAHARARD